MILMVSFWMVELKIQMMKMMVAILQMSLQVLLKMLTMKQKLGPEKPLHLMSMNEDYLKHQQKCKTFEQHTCTCKSIQRSQLKAFVQKGRISLFGPI